MKSSTTFTSLLLFGLLLCLYWRAPAPGMFENERSMQTNPSCPELLQARSLGDLRAPGASDLDQPLGRLGLRLASSLGTRDVRGTTPESWQRWSALLHALVSLLFYWVLCRLLGSRSLALIGALLFGLHPMLVECVSWISMSARLQASLWMLLGLLAWCSPRSGTRLWAPIAGLLALAAHPIAAPMGILLMAISQTRKPRKRLEFGLALALLLSGILWLFVAHAGAPHALGLGQRLAGAGAAPLLHLSQALWPSSSADILVHPMFAPGLGAYVIGGWLFSACLLASGLWLLGREADGLKCIGIGAVWFIALSLGSALLPYALVIAADSDGYLALGGLVLMGLGACAYVLRSLPKVPRALHALAGLLLALLGYLSLREIEFRHSQIAVLMRALDATRSLQEPAKNFVAHRRLGLELFWHGDLTSADAHLEHALTHKADDTQALIGRASVAMQRDEKSTARSFLLQALECEPDNARAWERLGELNLRLGTAESNREAIHNLQLAVASQPDFGHAHSRLAALLSIQVGPDAEAQLVQAQASAERALELVLDAKEAWKVLGAVRARLGDPTGAMLAYRNSLSLEPDYSEALAGLGQLLRAEGDLERALPLLERCYFLHPLDETHAYELGSALLEAGELQQAGELFRATLALNRRHMRAREALGRIALDAGDTQQAIREGTTMLGFNSAHLGARLLLAEAYQRVADYTQAILCLKIALASHEDLLEVEARLALLLAAAPTARDRDAAKALAMATELVARTRGQHLNSLRALAAAQAENGDLKQAGQSLQRALELAPDEAKAVLRREAECYASGQALRLEGAAEGPASSSSAPRSQGE